MALTAFQRTICRLIAEQRIRSGESYVAGGVALNALTDANRVSKDIDLFHDTEAAVLATWDADRRLLEGSGYQVEVVRERGTFIEAVVRLAADSIILQWAPDSAYRFFPLLRHADFGLTLHPFDLATNKVLALVGRLEVRDWVDLINCHERIQPLGCLAWAACGKDPGFSPQAILEQAARSARYSAVEVAELAFAGLPPDAADLSRRWHGMLREAHEIVAVLPTEHVGQCVLNEHAELFCGTVDQLRGALREGRIQFHEGRIRGALPQSKMR